MFCLFVMDTAFEDCSSDHRSSLGHNAALPADGGRRIPQNIAEPAGGGSLGQSIEDEAPDADV